MSDKQQREEGLLSTNDQTIPGDNVPSSNKNNEDSLQNELNNSDISGDIIYPEETKFKVFCNCGCYKLIQTLPDDRIYCRHWELHICMPIFVMFLIFGNLLTFIFISYPLYPAGPLRIAAILEIGIVLILFIFSYFAAACSDPGYLPYDWIKTRKFYYTWQEQIPGIAIRDEQIEFAKNHRAPGASFSKAAGRFVLRADHICGWVTNWIGKRNHKLFLLMLFWGSLFCGSLCSWQFAVPHWPIGGKLILLILSGSIEIVFFLGLSSTMIGGIFDLLHNQTQIDKWKKRQNPPRPCMEMFREICGNRNLLCWLIPVPAFDENLVISNDVPPGDDDV